MGMAEYIDREAAVNAVLNLVPKVDDDGYCWVIRGDAARAIDSIPAADVRPVEWIPVKERLPKHAYGEGDSVLTVSSLGSMRVLYFDGGNWCYPTGEALTTARKYPITHWMPLPQAPKEE